MVYTKSLSPYVHWLYKVTLGEFLGFLIPSVVGVATVALELSGVAQMAAMIVAGAGEGAVLGYFQASVMGSYLKGFPRKRWIKVTMLGASIAWAIGMMPSTVGEKVSMVPVWLLMPLAVLLGFTLLITIGYAQYMVLRTSVKNANKWIWINVLAWLVGLIVVCSFIFVAPDGAAMTIIFSAAGGLGMACTMAAITGIYAQKIVQQQSL